MRRAPDRTILVEIVCPASKALLGPLVAVRLLSHKLDVQVSLLCSFRRCSATVGACKGASSLAKTWFGHAGPFATGGCRIGSASAGYSSVSGGGAERLALQREKATIECARAFVSKSFRFRSCPVPESRILLGSSPYPQQHGTCRAETVDRNQSGKGKDCTKGEAAGETGRGEEACQGGAAVLEDRAGQKEGQSRSRVSRAGAR